VPSDPRTREELKRLGEYLREERRRLRLSQEDFAEFCGLHRTYMGELERGETNLAYENTAKIARALGMRASELLRRAGL
jgi:transcriptional regulator with XRE-family HTH domain